MILSFLPIAAIASWMLYALLVGGVIIVAAMAAHDAQRAANRAVRWVWFGAIVSIVAFSAMAPWRENTTVVELPRSVGEVPLQTTSALRQPRSALDTWVRETRDVVAAPFAAVLQLSRGPLDRLPLNVHRLLALGWVVASVGTIGVFALSYRRSRRRVNQWPIQQVGETSARISPSVGPAVIGLAPSEIILPSWLLQRPAEEQRLVVAHESEHVRAHDPWLLVVACGAVALMPWHPALWYALGRLRLAVELDCDRRVLRQGIPAASYGALLIDLSALRTPLPSAMPAFTCSGSYLERRLVAMTARRSRFATSRRALGALIAVAAIATACESKLPTSAEINAMDATTALAAAEDAALVDVQGAQYVVDDKVVSEALAKAIPAGEIAEVRIQGKSSTGTSKGGEIHLRTKKALSLTIPDTSAAAVAELKKVQGVRLRQSQDQNQAYTKKQAYTKERAFTGLLVIDGKVMESSTLDRLRPESIATVEVVKGEAAKSRYSDARAANGVIVVTTKKQP